MLGSMKRHAVFRKEDCVGGAGPVERAQWSPVQPGAESPPSVVSLRRYWPGSVCWEKGVGTRGRLGQTYTSEEAKSVVQAGGPSSVGSGADGHWGAVWDSGSQAGHRELTRLGGLPTPARPSEVFLIRWCLCAQGDYKQLRFAKGIL